MTAEQRPRSTLLEPAPQVDPAAAAAIVSAEYGLTVRVERLESERDSNFLVSDPSHRQLVLKVSNAADDVRAIEMECAAMRHIREVDPALRIPSIVPSTSGRELVVVVAPDGRKHQARLITLMPGKPADRSEVTASFAQEFGMICARTAKALRGFNHPASSRRIEWDPRKVTELRPWVDHLTEPGRRSQLQDLLDRLAGIPDAARTVPSGVMHGDLTLGNILLGPSGRFTGLIDFGDLHHTARVCDLAIALSSVIRAAADPWGAAGRFLEGYQRLTPLESDEVSMIGELMVARTVAALLISARRAPMDPANHRYVTGRDRANWRALQVLLQSNPEALQQRFHRLCGTSRIESTQRPDPSLRRRRGDQLGGRLAPLFYAEPLHIVRGSGAWLQDAKGRRYLDAYNNVPVVGHAHPAVVQAIAGQAAVLNVNSRYLHANVVELAERLTATMPAPLDTCILMNSGSEANDLAWRMAAVATGHSGAIVTDHAYHGVSAVTSALSTNTYPATDRPDWVATFRVRVPGPDGAIPGAREAADDIRLAWDSLAAGGHGVALLGVDPVFSSVGILEPSKEYLQELVRSTRAAGGLFLADEVQSGFGRGGRNLWRFQDFDLVPDFVTLGKPMGNGHPVAALITRGDIARQFAATDEYFSTFGGNPVSCAAALTVLDLIEDSNLVRNADRMGNSLRAGLNGLADRLDWAIQVRGPGLMIGIDLTGHAQSASPLAERLRQNGVLVGATGRGGRVLKIRPPLIWGQEHVDHFLERLSLAIDDRDGRRRVDA